jgi:hypothetical protein
MHLVTKADRYFKNLDFSTYLNIIITNQS